MAAGSQTAAPPGLSSDQARGLALACSSAVFIGSSFIIKKKGLRVAGASGTRAGLRAALSLLCGRAASALRSATLTTQCASDFSFASVEVCSLRRPSGAIVLAAGARQAWAATRT
jgi:hypothetical protein